MFDRKQLYRGTPASLAGTGDQASVDVVDADASELRRVSRQLAITLPQVELEAFSLSEDSLGLEEFTRTCRDRGYERARRVFVARESRETVAALVAESGDDGINVFGLLDCCWVVTLGRPLAPSDGVLLALLRAAGRHYGSLGKRSFLLWGDPSWSSGAFERLGLCHVARAIRWIASRRLLPAYLSYMEDTVGMPRSPRAERPVTRT